MYSGSSGVLLAVWRFVLFLRKSNAPQDQLKLYEDKFEKALGENMELIGFQEHEPNFSSFYGSEMIGLGTLKVISMLDG